MLTQKTFNFIILKQIKTWKDVIPMQPDKSSYLIEQILHQTQSRPFSLHHTVVYPNMTSALYLHCHSEMEFFYLEQGNVQFQIEDAKFTLQAGDAIFIPPNLLHSAKRMGDPTEDCSFYAIVTFIQFYTVLPIVCSRFILLRNGNSIFWNF